MHKNAYECKMCERLFFFKDSYREHLSEAHCSYEKKIMKPMLKNKVIQMDDMKEHSDAYQIITDLNTQLNGTTSKRERELIRLIKQIVKVKHEGNNFPCKVCDHSFKEKGALEEHKVTEHEKIDDQCAKCNQTVNIKDTSKEHRGAYQEHQDMQTIFLTHHEQSEEDVDDIEFDPTL